MSNRRGAAVWLGLALASGAVRAEDAPRCLSRDGRNGSALCAQLRLEAGQVVVAGYRFAANSSYQGDAAAAEDFAAEARVVLSRLPKVCAPAMSRDQLQRYMKDPRSDPATRDLCEFSGTWQEFLPNYQRWAVTSGAREPAAILDETQLFRPLVTLYQRSPLLWIQTTSESFNAETGVLILAVADRFDPRTAATLQIRIRGLPDGAVKDRRIAELRRWLNPLRGTVVCHERIRSEVRRYYAGIQVEAEFVRIDSQGVLVEIDEAAAP